MRALSAIRALTLAIAAIVLSTSCGSVTATPDGGTAGASAGGTTGAAGTTTGGAAGTSAGGSGGVASTGTGGTTGGGGLGGLPDGGPLACHVDLNDCPTGYTCACGGAGVGMCTCHKNCTDTTACPSAEPMCGCPSATGGGARFCVNACFCNCR